ATSLRWAASTTGSRSRRTETCVIGGASSSVEDIEGTSGRQYSEQEGGGRTRRRTAEADPVAIPAVGHATWDPGSPLGEIPGLNGPRPGRSSRTTIAALRAYESAGFPAGNRRN